MTDKSQVPRRAEGGATVVRQALREYAHWRLGTLPRFDSSPLMSNELVEGYRRLDVARVEAEKRVIEASLCTEAERSSAHRSEARIARVLWDLTHRWLVAIELAHLQRTTVGVDDLRLVLMAEQRVEALVSDPSHPKADGPT